METLCRLHPIAKPAKMHPIKTINIPEPCHQQWQQMAAAGNGRYCDHCCKTVVDFSVMSNDEVIAYLSTNVNVCGRFEKRQLDGLSDSTPARNKRQYFRRYMLMAASVIGLMPVTTAMAHIGPILPVDSPYKKHQAKYNGTRGHILKQQTTKAGAGKIKGKTQVKNKPANPAPNTCLPVNDVLMGKVLAKPTEVKVVNFQLIRSRIQFRMFWAV